MINPDPLTIQHTGRQGCPKKIIDPEYLRSAFHPGRNIPATRVAKALGVHPNSVHMQMRQHGLTRNFAPFTDEDLEAIVGKFREIQPDSGL